MRPSEVALDLDDVAVTQRVDTFSRWAERHFPGVSVASMRPTRARAEQVQLGGAQLWRLNAPSGLTLRTGPVEHGARSVVLLLQVAGTTTLRSDPGLERLGAGDVSVFGGQDAKPVEMMFSDDEEHLLLTVPEALMTGRHPRFALSHRTHRADETGVRLLASALTAAARDARTLDSEQGSMLLASLLQLAGLPRPTITRAQEEDARVRRALRMVEEELHDPALDAPRIASACALSRRRLDQLFVEKTGMSVTAKIAEARLARAAELLADPRYGSANIIEVAFLTGFGEAAQFSRAFRARYGDTPSHYRRTRLASERGPSDAAASPRRPRS